MRDGLTTITLDQFAADLGRVEALMPEAARALLLQLAPLTEALRLRALGAPAGANGQPSASIEADRLLTPHEVAERLGVSVKWVYRHHQRLPFTRRLSRKALRFSEAGLWRWQGIRK